jgi:hypothetical protein
MPLATCRRQAALVLLLFLLLPRTSSANDAVQYARAVARAQANALEPAPWTVPDLRVITGPGTGDGNAYVDGLLVAATFTRERNVQGAGPGQPMIAFGQPETEAVWVTVGDALRAYWKRHGVTAVTAHRETSRALGMSVANANTLILELLVAPELASIRRPTRDPSIAVQPSSLGTEAPFVRPSGLDDRAWAAFTAWYGNWLAQAYGPARFPWTQLGYTYVWGRGDRLADIRGLSEFVVPGRTPYTAYALYSLQSFLYAAGSGNGDFLVSGTLDSLWAGRRFQPRGRQAVIAAGARLAGGQGVLVSSAGYRVVNGGEISGPTGAKYGLADSADVAVWFGGEAVPGHGLIEAADGPSFLDNAGRVESPGTAVRVAAGDAVLATSGRLAGGAFAVRTGDGADSLVVNGGTVSGPVDLGGGRDTLVTTGRASLAFVLDPADAAPPVRNVETVALGRGTRLVLAVAAPEAVADGQTFTIARAEALSLPPGGLAVTSRTPGIRFSALADGDTLRVVAHRPARPGPAAR